MSFHGLVECGKKGENEAVCIQKALELSFSLILLVAVAIILILRIRYERQFNFYVAINILMILSLFFNVFYTAFGVKPLYHLETFFFDLYFPTLVCKFGLKLVEKSNESGMNGNKRAIAILFAIYISMVAGDFIFITVQGIGFCKEIPYLVINFCGVTLSIWLSIFGYKLTKSEKENFRLSQNKSELRPPRIEASYANPMPSMWKCIIINILAQVIGLARTIYYVSDPSMDCRFTSNQSLEVAIQFMFLLTTYYIGMIATIFFFNEKRRSYFSWNNPHPRKSSDDQKVELINVANYENRDKAFLF